MTYVGLMFVARTDFKICVFDVCWFDVRWFDVCFSHRLRDLSNSEKQDSVRLQKQADKMATDSVLLIKDKERLQGELQQLQEELIELREHVSGSLYTHPTCQSNASFPTITQRNIDIYLRQILIKSIIRSVH